MKVYSFVTLVTLIITITSCSSKRFGVNKGSYSINKSHGKSGTMNPLVYGYLFEYGTKLPSNVPRVYVGKELKSKADPKSGQYSFSIKPGKHRFVGKGLGYYSTKTKRIKVSKGDSVNIDFYLKINETPLVD
jgi:hypothetical protein